MPSVPMFLAQWISERTGTRIDAVGIDMALFSSGLLDSFDLLDLVVMLEKTTGKKISAIDINLENFDTPSRIIPFISK